MKRFSLLALLVAATAAPIVLPSTAYALSEEEKIAEKMRLIEELNKLASKNAWAGVERSYMGLMDLGVDVSFDVHYIGAQSARYLGKTWEVYERLQRARAIDATEEIVSSMADIDASYGRVHIKGDARKRPVLNRPSMPFATDQRLAIEWAKTVVSETGSFDGMLPEGTYEIEGCFEFEVQRGEEWQDVVVPKKCGGEAELIVYAGPLFVLGPGFGSSGAPSDRVEGDLEQAQPASISEAGVTAVMGGEVGFTQTFAVAATVGYTGLFGGHSVHDITGTLSAAYRPGDVRVAFGPTWGFIAASGSGVYDHFYDGIVEGTSNEPILDTTQYPRSSIGYSGYALAGGLQFSAGYGVMDFGKLQGVVEVGGSWQTDTTRSYTGVGIRVGLVPKVPRFEG
ncbi:MAG: hypothetical protein JXX28_10615 [Deltaproteobacteria bacterium]|nr:hypothetical protein [Deltaproteobacteria bacterium]